jgi:hypothetical protein
MNDDQCFHILYHSVFSVLFWERLWDLQLWTSNQEKMFPNITLLRNPNPYLSNSFKCPLYSYTHLVRKEYWWIKTLPFLQSSLYLRSCVTTPNTNPSSHHSTLPWTSLWYTFLFQDIRLTLLELFENSSWKRTHFFCLFTQIYGQVEKKPQSFIS